MKTEMMCVLICEACNTDKDLLNLAAANINCVAMSPGVYKASSR